MLVVEPRLKAVQLPAKFSIRLHTCIKPNTFPLEKLKATKNNLRSVVAEQEGSNGDKVLLPTPHYNASILEVAFAEDFV